MSTWNLIVENFDLRELTNIVMELSSYHRIQGTKELVEAAKYIHDLLSDKTGFNVELRKFSYTNIPNYLGTLIGWSISEGRASIIKPKKYTLADYHQYPTSIVAFSPSGDFEGRVTYVGDGLSYDDPIDGIALTYGRGLDIYAKLVKQGAKAVIMFRRDLNPDGIPYLNLMPQVSEVKYLKAPAISISKRMALKMIRAMRKGLEVWVKGYVKSGFYDNAILPVVNVEVNNAEPELHIVAHFCHPRYMVNDNVSGAASLIESLIALWRSIKIINRVKKGLRAILIPEYFGSYTYLVNILNSGRSVYAALNLDMIGENQEVTNSTLNIVRPPIIELSPLEALIYINLSKVLIRHGIKYRLVNYDSGSDHDSYIALGIPAVMINQWPDKFYHTHLDTIDKLSLANAKVISTASLSSIVDLAIKDVDEILFLSYLNYVKGLDTINSRSREVLRVRLHVYREYVEKRYGVSIPPNVSGITKYSSINFKLEGSGGLILPRYLRHAMGLEEYLRLKKELRGAKWLNKALITIGATLSSYGRVSFNEVGYIVVSEVNNPIKPDYLLKLINILEHVGYLSIVRI